MRNLTARTNVQISGNSISIFNVEYFQDGGKYTCTANNTHGVAKVDAFLNLDCKSITNKYSISAAYVHICAYYLKDFKEPHT